MLVLGRLLEEEEGKEEEEEEEGEGEREEGTVLSRLLRKATGSGRLTIVMKLGPLGNTT